MKKTISRPAARAASATGRKSVVRPTTLSAKNGSVVGATVQAQTFADVFDAVARTPQEAANMRARADLTHWIIAAIKAKGWTQTVAAKHCGVDQSRIHQLMTGQLSKFSLDALVNIASTMGKVRVHVEELEAA